MKTNKKQILVALIMIMGSFSKNYGMSGLKIGTVLAEYPYNDDGQDTDDVMVSMKDMEMLGGGRGGGEVGLSDEFSAEDNVAL